jgi:hypothetical protein
VAKIPNLPTASKKPAVTHAQPIAAAVTLLPPFPPVQTFPNPIEAIQGHSISFKEFWRKKECLFLQQERRPQTTAIFFLLQKSALCGPGLSAIITHYDLL